MARFSFGLAVLTGLATALLTSGCAAPGTGAQIAASSSQVDGVMPVHQTYERKSDRWYSIGLNESLAFGGWHTGVIDRDFTEGSETHVQVGKFEWVKQKTGTTLQFALHSPYGDVCHVSINSFRKDKDFEVGGVVIGSGDDKVTGTIALTDGTTWPFDINNFHTETFIGEGLNGTVQVGSEVIKIREDNSGKKVLGVLSGLAGVTFNWNGHQTGKVSFFADGILSNKRSVELTPNIPAPIQTATAAMAATLLVVQKIDGPDSQSPGARKFEVFTD